MRMAATRLCAGDPAVFARRWRRDYADAYQASHRRDARPERKPTNRDAEFYHTRSVIKRPFCGHGMEKKHVAVARAARRRPDRQAREH
jgi:hypothetical protein